MKKNQPKAKRNARSREQLEVKNIRVLPSGYQVCVTRERTEFSKHFAGHSAKSLRLAEAYRDMLLRVLPPKRRHAVPPRVLAAVGLKQAVVGISRYPKRCYAVAYRNRSKQVKTRTFSWRTPKQEIDAYAAAVAFRRQNVKQG
ncbi:MAG: hypothetical protein DLM52_03995 [Chthoniobacterales bacterium]|nr:MAG: hypothetical protein DLM52_03995 [Chthoniobacterales bacterium]